MNDLASGRVDMIMATVNTALQMVNRKVYVLASALYAVPAGWSFVIKLDEIMVNKTSASRFAGLPPLGSWDQVGEMYLLFIEIFRKSSCLLEDPDIG